MSSVWIIECGEYSDYSVLGVFSTPDNARRVADAINASGDSDKATVAERILNPGVAELRAGMQQYHILMLRDGTVERCAAQTEVRRYDLVGSARVWERTKALFYKGRGVPDVLDATVWARDGEHAIKIANEKRAEMVALGQWPEVPHA